MILEELAKARRGPAYCRGHGSQTYHGVASAHPILHPELHETMCGWKFGVAPSVSRFDTIPVGVLYRSPTGLKPVEPCKKCWRDVAVAPAAEGAG